MGRRHPNPRLVKVNRTYLVDEVAALLGVHFNTVRNWLRSGLDAVDDRRPTLIHGMDLRRFLEIRRSRAKQSCPPGHMFCLPCRAPKRPAGDMVEFVPNGSSTGMFRAICPTCNRLMHQRAGKGNTEFIAASADADRHKHRAA